MIIHLFTQMIYAASSLLGRDIPKFEMNELQCWSEIIICVTIYLLNKVHSIGRFNYEICYLSGQMSINKCGQNLINRFGTATKLIKLRMQ